MLILRVVIFELLICVHMIGAAVLFRRWFPSESPWLGFLIPILVVLSGLNFIEHFVPLPMLGILLPFTLGGSVWLISKAGTLWQGLRFPATLFVLLFTFMLFLRCCAPEIANTNEGISNLTRVLNYDFGDKLPQTDSFLPSYSYGVYYSFQHYGAAVLKRLFITDVGTAYNLSYAFLLAWVCLMGAGVAHSISSRKWIAFATMLVLLAGWTGSCPYLIFFGPNGADYELSTNLNAQWDVPDHNPFSFLCALRTEHPSLLLQAPLINLYWSEYHSTLGGHFVVMATLLAASEVFKWSRSNWAWISLIVLPGFAIITSCWFIITVGFLCLGSLLLAWQAGHRPRNWRTVCIVAGMALMLLWPSIYSVTAIYSPEAFMWTASDDHTPVWMFLIQWWPVFIPWLFLTYAWPHLNRNARWMLIALPVLWTVFELFTFGDRKLTTEKFWASIYGAGLVTLLPLLLMQRRASYILLGLFIVILSPICLLVTLHEYLPHPVIGMDFAHLEGDDWLLQDSQKNRLIQVLRGFHKRTILAGRSCWNYSQSPGVVDFSGNRCFVAYTFHEYHLGRGMEADFRSQQDNAFYDGTIDPLPFLRGNKIDAVMIWPEDNISDRSLQKFEQQLNPEFFYIDCKLDGTCNAGLFVRQADLEVEPGMVGQSTQY